MPKAAVHKKDGASGAENEVGFSGEIAALETVAEAEGGDEAADGFFRFGVMAADAGHVPGALLGGKGIEAEGGDGSGWRFRGGNERGVWRGGGRWKDLRVWGRSGISDSGFFGFWSRSHGGWGAGTEGVPGTGLEKERGEKPAVFLRGFPVFRVAGWTNVGG